MLVSQHGHDHTLSDYLVFISSWTVPKEVAPIKVVAAKVIMMRMRKMIRSTSRLMAVRKQKQNKTRLTFSQFYCTSDSLQHTRVIYGDTGHTHTHTHAGLRSL